MSLFINHNSMAANTARNLNTHYGNLATSTRRLSSGLRINGAADDAAGLAIRELMRADIAAYNQGIRNANDAISMIQVVDGALGVIDEKLIRMKELAEQAATGTYDSTQRLMIDSEFQAMASEIQRIATATDFNGKKWINGLNSSYILDNSGKESTRTYIKNDNTATPNLSEDRAGSITYENIHSTIVEHSIVEYMEMNNSIYKKTTIESDITEEVDIIEKRIFEIHGFVGTTAQAIDIGVHGGRLVNPDIFDMDIYTIADPTWNYLENVYT